MRRHAWLITRIHGQRMLICLICERPTTAPDDIAKHRCAHCGVLLDDIHPDFEPHPVGPVRPPRLHPVADDVPEWQERRRKR